MSKKELKIEIRQDEGLNQDRYYRLSKTYQGSFTLDKWEAESVVKMLASDLGYNLARR